MYCTDPAIFVISHMARFYYILHRSCNISLTLVFSVATHFISDTTRFHLYSTDSAIDFIYTILYIAQILQYFLYLTLQDSIYGTDAIFLLSNNTRFYILHRSCNISYILHCKILYMAQILQYLFHISHSKILYFAHILQYFLNLRLQDFLTVSIFCTDLTRRGRAFFAGQTIVISPAKYH